jgi:hypothetical protein
MKKIVLLQEASIRALKMSGGRFEAALEFLPKQQQQQQQQNEPVNGMSKGASSGKLVNSLLCDPVCKLTNSMEQNSLKKLMFFHLLKKLPAFMERNTHCCVQKGWPLCLKQFRHLHLLLE